MRRFKSNTCPTNIMTLNKHMIKKERSLIRDKLIFFQPPPLYSLVVSVAARAGQRLEKRRVSVIIRSVVARHLFVAQKKNPKPSRGSCVLAAATRSGLHALVAAVGGFFNIGLQH